MEAKKHDHAQGEEVQSLHMVITSVGELLSFHPIFNPVVNLGITLIPWIVQH